MPEDEWDKYAVKKKTPAVPVTDEWDAYAVKKKDGTQPATNPSNGILQPSANGGVNTSQSKSQSVSPLQPKEQTYDGLLGTAIQRGNEMGANTPAAAPLPIKPYSVNGDRGTYEQQQQQIGEIDAIKASKQAMKADAQINTAINRLDAKGLPHTTANKASELIKVRKDIDNGDLEMTQQGDKPIYGRVPSFQESFTKGLIGTIASVSDDIDMMRAKTPRERSDLLESVKKRKEEFSRIPFGIKDLVTFNPYISNIDAKSLLEKVEASKDLTPTVKGGLGNEAASFIGSIIPKAVMAYGTAGIGNAFQAATTSIQNKTEELYDKYQQEALENDINAQNQYHQTGEIPQYIKDSAAEKAAKNAPAQAAPSAILDAILMEGHTPNQTASKTLANTIFKSANDAARMGAKGALSEEATMGIEALQGDKVKDPNQRILNKFKEFALMDAVVSGLPSIAAKAASSIPKYIQSAMKEYATRPENRPIVEEAIKNDPNAPAIKAELDKWQEDRKSLEGIVDDEKMPTVLGLKQKIDALNDKAKNSPEALKPIIEAQKEAANKQIEKVLQSDEDPLNFEHDDKSGQPLKSTTVIMPKSVDEVGGAEVKPIEEVSIPSEGAGFKKGDQVTLLNGKKGEISEIKNGKVRVSIKGFDENGALPTRDLGWHDLTDIQGEANPIEKTKEQVEAQGRVDDFVNGLAEANPELHKIATDNPIAALDKLIDHHKEQLKGTTPTTKAYSEKAIAKFEALKEDYKLANEIKTEAQKPKVVSNVSEPLKDVESTANALDDLDKDGKHSFIDIIDEKIAALRSEDGSVPDEKLNEFKRLRNLIGDFGRGFSVAGQEYKVTSKDVSEAYHKAKQDGSNPELVKQVEDLLTKQKENETQNTQKPIEQTDAGLPKSDELIAPKEKSTIATEVDEVKSAASKTKVSQSLRDKAKAVREKGYNEAFKLPHIKLDEGTQTAGFGGKGLDNAIAKSLEIVADSIDAGKELFDSAKDGFEHLKDYYAKNSNRFDEDKLRDEFINGIAENKQEADKLREQFSKKEPPKPPIEEPKGGVYSEYPAFNMKHSELERVRGQFGLEEVGKEKISNLEAAKNATDTIAEWKEKGEYKANINKVINEGLEGKGTDKEQNILAQHIVEVRDALSAMDRYSEKYDKLSAEMDRATEAGKIMRSEFARGLGRHDLQFKSNSINSILDIESMLKEDSGVDVLTEQQKKQAETLYEPIEKTTEEAAKYSKEAEEEIQRLKAENELLRQKNKNKGGVKKTKHEYNSEREVLVKNIKDKWKNAGKDLLSSDIPYRKQLVAIAPDVARLIASYVHEAASITLAEVKKRLKKDIEDAGIPISEEDVSAFVAGEFSEKKTTRNDLAQKLNDLRTEERLLRKIDELQKGGEPISEAKKVEKNQKFKELKDKIRELSKKDELEINEDDINDKKIEDKIKRNKLKQEEYETKLKQGDFGKGALAESILDTELLKERNPQLYDRYAKSLVEKDNAYAALERARIDIQRKNLTKLQKAGDYAKIAIATSQGTVAMFDQSVFLVQMMPYTFSHPIKAAKFAAEALRYDFVNKKRFDQTMAILHNSTLGKIALESGLAIYEPQSLKMELRAEQYGGDKNLWNREFTIKGKKYSVGQAFERSTVSMLNNARLDLFVSRATSLYEEGKTFESNPEEFKALARAANELTGHGKVAPVIEKILPDISRGIWSPKMFSSTLNLLGFGDIIRPTATIQEIGRAMGIKIEDKGAKKGYYTSLTPAERKFAAKEVGRFLATGVTIMLVAKAIGGKNIDLDDDPRSSGFGSIKFKDSGNSFPVFGRFGSVARTITQFVLGTKAYDNGNTSDLSTQKDGLKGGRFGVAYGSFIRGKETPLAGVVSDLVFNKGYNYFTNEKLDAKTLAKQLVIPMGLQDIGNDIKEDGVSLAAAETIFKLYGGNIRKKADFQKIQQQGKKMQREIRANKK